MLSSGDLRSEKPMSSNFSELSNQDSGVNPAETKVQSGRHFVHGFTVHLWNQPLYMSGVANIKVTPNSVWSAVVSTFPCHGQQSMLKTELPQGQLRTLFTSAHM